MGTVVVRLQGMFYDALRQCFREQKNDRRRLIVDRFFDAKAVPPASPSPSIEGCGSPPEGSGCSLLVLESNLNRLSASGAPSGGMAGVAPSAELWGGSLIERFLCL